MFDNIVANNEINFNELEQKIYKFVCELGCNILKNIIEKYDAKLQDERDKKAFRHRGLKPDSIKTAFESTGRLNMFSDGLRPLQNSNYHLKNLIPFIPAQAGIQVLGIQVFV